MIISSLHNQNTMGALSFKQRFVKPVLAGLQRKKGGKRQSIRNFRKRPLKVGERVVLYYAQRTKYCKKLGESLIKKVQIIEIKENAIVLYDPTQKGSDIFKIVNTYNTKAKLDRFSRADGFKDFEDMKAFWLAEHGKNENPFPYTGNLYKW